MRPMTFRNLGVGVHVMPVVGMARSRHHAFAHFDIRTIGSLVVRQVHTVVRHMSPHIRTAGAVGFVERHHTEVAAHRSAAFAHAVPLAGGAAFSADFVAGRVACVLGHFRSPVGCLGLTGPLLAVGGCDGLGYWIP